MKTLSLSVALVAVTAAAAQQPMPLRKLVDKVNAHLVTVRVHGELKDPLGRGAERYTSTRCGVVVDAKGLIMVDTQFVDPVANFRAALSDIDDADIEDPIGKPSIRKIEVVVTKNGKTKAYTAALANTNLALGLSFLKVSGLGSKRLSALPLAEAGKAKLGDIIYTVARLKAHHGFAPFYQRSEVVGTLRKPGVALALATPLSHGHPVFSRAGKLVGFVAHPTSKQAKNNNTGNSDQPNGMFPNLFRSREAGQPTSFVVAPASIAKAVASARRAASKSSCSRK